MFKIGDRVIYQDTEVTIKGSFDNDRLFAIELDEEAIDNPHWLGAMGVHVGVVVKRGRGKWARSDQLQPMPIKPAPKGTFIYVMTRMHDERVIFDTRELASLDKALDVRNGHRARLAHRNVDVYLKLD